MGVCYLQHRNTIGIFNSRSIPMLKCRPKVSHAKYSSNRSIFGFLTFLILYIYIICIMLAMAVDLKGSSAIHVAYVTCQINYNKPSYYLNNSRDLLNSGVLALITLLLNRWSSDMFGLLNRFGLISMKKVGKLKLNFISKLGIYLSYWVTLLNL